MVRPRVSIATVTYRNLEQTRQFIESACATCVQDFELIVVDNGSGKDVANFLDSLEGKIENYKLIRNKSNLGIGPAMYQAMKACTTDYIFRADSDVVLLSNGWDVTMCSYVDRFPEVGAVGTAITGGKFIPRCGATIVTSEGGHISLRENGGYIETDICLSNFMLIPRRTINAIAKRAVEELPTIRKRVSDIVMEGKPRWEGYFGHLGSLVDYMTYHAGYWNPAYPYGTDDMDYSMWVRWAGLKIAKAPTAEVFHKDESMRPDFKDERHRRVSIGFQVWRAAWEVLENHTGITSLDWDCWPMNIAYAEEQKRTINGK